MLLDDFNYELPAELIATEPSINRTSSRLMHVSGNKCYTKFFSNLTDILQPGDLLVLNDTKVIPARMYARKNTGAKVEILIEEVINGNSALAMLKTNGKISLPCQLHIYDSDIVINCTKKYNGAYLLEVSDKNIANIIEKHGHMPLPPYMQRHAKEIDIDRYQTVYAKNPGAIAAPTAGLHFDKNMLQTLQEKGINIAYVTLHVGSGTFTSVREQDLSKHKMHSEYINVSSEVANIWAKTKQNGGRVIAVGTTAVRSLESAWNSFGVQATTGKTNLFITPGYKFNAIDGLITNFHLPKSTLLMLTCAFGGHENVMSSYLEAVRQKYKFFSYGDAMLIL